MKTVRVSKNIMDALNERGRAYGTKYNYASRNGMVEIAKKLVEWVTVKKINPDTLAFLEVEVMCE